MNLSIIEHNCAVENTVLDTTIKNDPMYWTKIGPETKAKMIESYKASSQKRLEFTNKRIKEALNQTVPSWETMNKVALDVKKRVEASGHIVDKDYPLIDGLTKLSPQEKAERASIQKDYTDKIIALASKHATTSSLASMIASSHHRINRSTNAFLAESGEDGYEKSVKNAEIFLNGTDEEKIAFIESKFRKALEVYDLLTDKIYSDREACEVLIENYDTVHFMSEFEKISDIENDFGIKLPDSPLVREIKEKAPAMVGIALYKNLLGDVISPSYLEFDQKEIYQLKSSVAMLLPANNALKQELTQIKESLANAISPNEYVKSNLIIEALLDTQKPFPYKLNELFNYTENGNQVKAAREEMVKDNIEKQNFPEGAKFVGLDNVEMDKETAIRNIANGKIVNVFDKDNQLVKNYSEYSKFATIFEKGVDSDLRIDDMSPEQIKAAFKDIQKEVNGATRIFMRSSQEFRDFRSAIDRIVNMDPEDLSSGILLSEMENVAKTAESYLNLKQKPGTSITANTEARIRVANKVSNLMRVSLAMQEERKHNLDTVKVGSYEEFQKGLEENLRDEFEDLTDEYTKSGKKIYKISEVDKAVYKAEQNKLNVEFESVYVDQKNASEFIEGDVKDMMESEFYKDLGSDSNGFPSASEPQAEQADFGDKLVKDEKDPPSV